MKYMDFLGLAGICMSIAMMVANYLEFFIAASFYAGSAVTLLGLLILTKYYEGRHS